MIPSDLKILLCNERKCYNLNTLTTLTHYLLTTGIYMSEINQTLDNSKFGFTDNELKLIETVTKKYNSYATKSDKQQIFLALMQLQNPTELDIKKIRAILALEKKLVQTGKKQARLNNLLKKDKADKRKLIEQRKYVWGGACLSGLEDKALIGGKFGNLTYEDLYNQMFDSGIFDKKDEKGMIIDKPHYNADGVHIFNEFIQKPNIAPKPKPVRNKKSDTADASPDATQSTQVSSSTNTPINF